MAISSILRNFNGEPNIVTIVCDDSLTTITTAGYLTGTAIAADIVALQNAPFEWATTDAVLIYYSGGMGFFTYDSANAAFVANPAQAGSILSSMVSPLLMQYAAIDITAAEFNGMYAAPKLLVAAQGANTLITLHRAELLMTYNSAQYAAGGVVAIQYDSTANGAGIIASTTQAAADFADAVSTANAFEGGIVKQPFSTCVNKGLYLSNVTQAFTTGDSDMVMHAWYSVVPTA